MNGHTNKMAAWIGQLPRHVAVADVHDVKGHGNAYRRWRANAHDHARCRAEWQEASVASIATTCVACHRASWSRAACRAR